MKISKDPAEIQARFAEPFPYGAVTYKPQTILKTWTPPHAIPAWFVDARDVAERLDNVVGIGNWKTEFTVLPEGQVVCRLGIRVSGEWVSKEDTGFESSGLAQQGKPDKGLMVKSAFSDAFKRAAVQWGIGRYLYRINIAPLPYDMDKRKFLKQPVLPPWALPGGSGLPPLLEQAREREEEREVDAEAIVETPPQQTPVSQTFVAKPQAPAKAAPTMDSNVMSAIIASAEDTIKHSANDAALKQVWEAVDRYYKTQKISKESYSHLCSLMARNRLERANTMDSIKSLTAFMVVAKEKGFLPERDYYDLSRDLEAKRATLNVQVQKPVPKAGEEEEIPPEMAYQDEPLSSQ